MTFDIIIVTIVTVAAQVLSFEFENDELSCMTSGTSALMTCHTVGYPRPTVVFTKDSIPIIPGVGNFQRYTAVKFDQVLACVCIIIMCACMCACMCTCTCACIIKIMCTCTCACMCTCMWKNP